MARRRATRLDFALARATAGASARGWEDNWAQASARGWAAVRDELRGAALVAEWDRGSGEGSAAVWVPPRDGWELALASRSAAV
jgi:hypothetical protein